MYSPKIDESLIPILYRLGKARRTRMTRLVNELIRKALAAEQLPEEIRAMMPPTGGMESQDKAAA